MFFGYRPMMRVVDGLETLGYLESHKGFQDLSTGRSRQSRMMATSKLIDLIDNYDVVPSHQRHLLYESSILPKLAPITLNL